MVMMRVSQRHPSVAERVERIFEERKEIEKTKPLHLSISKKNGKALCGGKSFGNISYRYTDCRDCQVRFGKSRGRSDLPNTFVRPNLMQMRGVSANGSAVR